jgi:N-acetyl-anhydromuramyl-L-alanine amidase AmpD
MSGDKTREEPSNLKPESFPSPNCDDRPGSTIVDTVVVHATVLDSIEEVIRHFAATASGVSAHYTIGRDGRIVSHVPEDKRAWHAGQSRMQDGRTQVNDFSIGIELVNRNDGVDPFPASQIQALRRLLQSIMSRHDIRHVVPHYECADPPGRKSDPAGYDASWIRDLLSRDFRNTR